MHDQDKDPSETQEWVDSLDSVIRYNGRGRAAYLLQRLVDRAVDAHVDMPPAITTPYRNTISPVDEKRMPGDMYMAVSYTHLTLPTMQMV